MPGKLGSLVVSLGIDAAEFTAGLTKSQVQAASFANRLRRDVNGAIRDTTIALGVMSAVGGTAFAFLSTRAQQINDFQRVAEQIGDTSTAVAGLDRVAATSQTGLQDIAAASAKLTQNLAKTDDEGTAAGATLKALGIDLAQFKQLTPTQQFDELAVSLDKFQDGAGKTSAAISLFGRAGATLLPFLHDLASAQGHQSQLTQQQIEDAVAFTKELAAMKNALSDASQAIAVKFLPGLTEMLRELEDGIRIAGSFGAALLELGTINPFNDIDQNIAETKDRIKTLQDFQSGKQFTLTQALGLDTVSSQLKTAQDQLAFLLRQKERLDASGGFGMNDRSGVPLAKPKLNIDLGNLGDTSRNILAGQLKAQEDAVRAEQQLLNSREQFLASYYQDDQLGLRDYFAGRQTAITEAFAAESTAYDKEIAALRAFIAKAKPTDRIDAETKLQEVIAKRAALEQDTGSRSIQIWLDEQRAIQALKDSIEQTSIALANMRGDTVAAAAAQFDFSNRRLVAQLTLLQASPDQGDQRLAKIGLDAIAQARQLTIARASLAKATDDYTNALDRLGVVQAQIDNLSTAGAITELQALRARSDATEAFLPALRSELAAVQAIAAVTGDPKDILHAQQLAVQIGNLAAQGDLVAKKFNDIGSSAFSQFLQDAITGAKSLKDAFLDLTKSLEQSLAKIASDDIAQQLFGKGGALGGFGDFFSKLFTGGPGAGNALAGIAGGVTDSGQAAAATAAAAALTAMTATTTATDVALASLSASAAAAAAALATVSASSAATGLSGFFGSAIGGLAQGGGLAGGTDFWRGGRTWVGENGPEIVNLPRGAQVVPSDVSRRMAGGDIRVSVNVMPGASRATADQAAAAMVKQLKRAQRVT